MTGSPPRHASREQLTCRHGSVRVAPRANPCHARPYGQVTRLEKVERGQRRRSSAEHEGNNGMRQRVAQLHVGKASGRTTYARRMPAERAERFHLLPGGGIPHSVTRGVQKGCGALRFEGLGHGPKNQACWLVFPRTGRAQALSARRAPAALLQRMSNQKLAPLASYLPHRPMPGALSWSVRRPSALRRLLLCQWTKNEPHWLVFSRTGPCQAL